MATSSSARKVLPKRLEEDLAEIPRFRLPSQRNEAPTMRDVMDDSIERAMYDQILGPLINRRPTSSSSANTLLARAGSTQTGNGTINNTSCSRPSSSQSAHATAPPLPNDSFNSSILSRLGLVEGDNKELRRQVAEKVIKIDQLERDNRSLKRQLDAANSSHKLQELTDELEEARAHGMELESTLEEMEQFLNDYGLVWVGTSSNAQQHENKQKPPSPFHLLRDSNPDNFNQTLSSETSVPGVDPHEFIQKVAALNRIIMSEPSQIKIQPNTRTARLLQASEAVEHIPIILFRNGLFIKRGPFRENGSSSYLSFVRDVVDGYFPSEYRTEYPDGVILELTDKHNEDYKLGLGGAGQQLDPMGSSHLLRRMPQKVIKNGHVVTIRDEVDRLLTNSSGLPSIPVHSHGAPLGTHGAHLASSGNSSLSTSIILKDTDAAGKKKQSIIILPTPAASASPGVISFVTVQVRWVDGTVLQAKLFMNDIVGDLREHIRRHVVSNTEELLGREEMFEFELRAAYPPRVLCDSMTLEEAGLVPSGVVHTRRLNA